MILDITFVDGSGPVQYQHVRRTAVYCQPEPIADGATVQSEPVLVIYFYDDMYPVMHIDVKRINCLTTTND